MSDMYRAEALQYGALLELVADVNDETLRRDPDLKASLERAGELDRLSSRAPWHSPWNSAGARRDPPPLRGHGDVSSRLL